MQYCSSPNPNEYRIQRTVANKLYLQISIHQKQTFNEAPDFLFFSFVFNYSKNYVIIDVELLIKLRLLQQFEIFIWTYFSILEILLLLSSFLLKNSDIPQHRLKFFLKIEPASSQKRDGCSCHFIKSMFFINII